MHSIVGGPYSQVAGDMHSIVGGPYSQVAGESCTSLKESNFFMELPLVDTFHFPHGDGLVH